MSVLLKWWKSRMMGAYKHLPGAGVCAYCGHDTRAYKPAVTCVCAVTTDATSETNSTALYDTDDERRNETAGWEPRRVPRHHEECCHSQTETVSLGDIHPTHAQAHGDATTAPPSDDSAKHVLNEFNFTLYDFDGHGKATQDDISGLVRAIYDAVGTSLQLPVSGSQTINVRLTLHNNNNDSQTATKPQHASSPAYNQRIGDKQRHLDGGRRQLRRVVSYHRCSEQEQSGIVTQHSGVDDVTGHVTRSPHTPDSACCRLEGATVEEEWRQRDGGATNTPPNRRHHNNNNNQQHKQQEQHNSCRQDYELLARCAQFALSGGAAAGGEWWRARRGQQRHQHKRRATTRHVLAWLERAQPNSLPPPSAASDADGRGGAEGRGSKSDGGRVMHHHVHEHVHHHYHHLNTLGSAVFL